jgi:hypothetical protein
MPILLAALVAAAPVKLPAAAPRLLFDAEGFSFGKVRPGTRVSHGFLATNAGSAPLVIRQVRASCGCTSALVGDTVLAPGGRTTITATFNTTGLAGYERKTILVRSNDPLGPDRVLTFDAVIEPAVLASTGVVSFRGLGPDAIRKATVRLTSTTGEPIVITDMVLSAAPWLGVATREAGREAWVDLELAGSRLPPGKTAGVDRIEVHAANPGASVIHLEVRWDTGKPGTD